MEDNKYANICPEKYITEKENVTYRNIEHISYFSNSVGCERYANVVLPMNYSTDRKYPVLYILHGIFGDENTMLYSENSKIPEILGNMVMEGEARETILVYASMYATADKNLAPAFSPDTLHPYNFFINDLVGDLIPYIESKYSCLTDRKDRGIAGFSMGGMETLYIALSRSDLFDSVVAIAPCPGLIPGKDWAMEHVGLLKVEELKYAHSDCVPKNVIICGGDKDSVVGKWPSTYHEVFEKQGIEHTWYLAPDTEHNERIVQSAIYCLLKLWK